MAGQVFLADLTALSAPWTRVFKVVGLLWVGSSNSGERTADVRASSDVDQRRKTVSESFEELIPSSGRRSTATVLLDRYWLGDFLADRMTGSGQDRVFQELAAS